MDIFICPVCKHTLSCSEKAYVCKNRHSYDISKYGYVNLLMSQKSSKKRHGDDKLMIESRQSFLNKNFYKPLLDCITDIVSEKSGGNPLTVLDAGCGEGYYSAGIKKLVPWCNMYGIDISKDALRFAHKRDKELALAAASCNKLPFSDESFDVILNIFSPTCADEYSRVLKTGGILIRAVPLKNHLFELKSAVYDRPYKNPEEAHTIEGFTLSDIREIKYTLHLRTNEEVKALFMMTPYYYKTSRTDQQKLDEVYSLDVRAEFGIELFTKK